MHAWRPGREDLRRLFALALPVVLVQLGMMAMTVEHTIMLGHVSAADLAAGALGNLYVQTVFALGWGTLAVLDVVVSQAVGARDEGALARGVQRGLVLAALLSALTVLPLFPARAVFAI